MDSAIHRINHYPVDNVIGFLLLMRWIVIYSVDSGVLQCLNQGSLRNISGMLLFCGEKLNRHKKTKVQTAKVISLRFALVL